MVRLAFASSQLASDVKILRIAFHNHERPCSALKEAVQVIPTNATLRGSYGVDVEMAPSTGSKDLDSIRAGEYTAIVRLVARG